MPTYEYACRNCGSHLEVVQSFSDDPLTDCPHCGGSLRKVFGSIGITFKGSGFYKTDSRVGAPGAKAGKGEADKGEKGDKAAAGAKAGGESSSTSESSSSSASGASGSSGSSGDGGGGKADAKAASSA